MGIDALDGADPCYFANYGAEFVPPELIPSKLNPSKSFDCTELAFPTTPSAQADLVIRNKSPASAPAYRSSDPIPQYSTRTGRGNRHLVSPARSDSRNKPTNSSSPSRSIGVSFDAFINGTGEMEFLDDILMELCPMSTDTITRISSRTRSLSANSNSTIGDQASSVHQPPIRYPRSSICGSIVHDTDLEESSSAHATNVVSTSTPIVPPELEQGPNMLSKPTRNKQKSHLCDFAECGLAFTTRSNLRRHYDQKHRRTIDVQPTPRPMESASKMQHSIESEVHSLEDAGGLVDAPNSIDSSMPIDEEEDDEPVQKGASLQLVTYGPPAPTSSIDSGSRAVRESTRFENGQRLRTSELVPRAIVSRNDPAHTQRIDYTTHALARSASSKPAAPRNTPRPSLGVRTFRPVKLKRTTAGGKNGFEMAKVCDLDPGTLAPYITCHSALETDQAGSMDINNIFRHLASSSFMEFTKQKTHQIVFDSVICPSTSIRRPYSKIMDRLMKAAIVTMNRVAKVRIPTKYHRPTPTRLLTKLLTRVPAFTKRQRIQRFQAASALGLLCLYTLSRDPGLSGFQGFSYASGSGQTPSNTRPPQGNGAGIWSGQGPGLESSCIPGQEINVDPRDVSEALKHFWSVLSAAPYNAHASGSTPGQPEFAPNPPPPLDFDGLLRQTYSNGFLDGIKYALSELCCPTGAHPSSVQPGSAVAHTEEINLHPPPALPMLPQSQCRQSNPTSLIADPTTMSSCAPNEAGPRLYAPIVSPVTHSVPPYLAASIELEPSYRNTLPGRVSSTVNLRADRPEQGWDIRDFGQNHDVQTLRNCNPTPDGTRSIVPRDIASTSAPQIQTVRHNPPLSPTEVLQPESMPSPGSRGKDDQRHKCSMCDRSFRKPYLLEDHMQSKHLRGDKLYACDFGECDRTFSTRSNLRKHIRIKHAVGEGISSRLWESIE